MDSLVDFLPVRLAAPDWRGFFLLNRPLGEIVIRSLLTHHISAIMHLLHNKSASPAGREIQEKGPFCEALFSLQSHWLGRETRLGHEWWDL